MQLDPIYNNNESGGVTEMCADIREAQTTLKYEPRISLESGIQRTIDLDKRFK